MSSSSANWRASSGSPPTTPTKSSPSTTPTQSPPSFSAFSWETPSPKSSRKPSLTLAPSPKSSRKPSLTEAPSPTSPWDNDSQRRGSGDSISSIKSNSSSVSKNGKYIPTKEDFHGNLNIHPGSILFLPKTTRALNGYMGNEPKSEAFYNHPVLVTKINDHSVEVLQCTSFNGRGFEAWELEKTCRGYIGIDAGRRGEKFSSKLLPNITLSQRCLGSVLEKPTLACPEVCEFRFGTFGFLFNKDNIPRISQDLFENIYQRIYQGSSTSSGTTANSNAVSVEDIRKACKPKVYTSKMPATFGPYSFSPKKLSIAAC